MEQKVIGVSSGVEFLSDLKQQVDADAGGFACYVQRYRPRQEQEEAVESARRLNRRNEVQPLE